MPGSRALAASQASGGQGQGWDQGPGAAPRQEYTRRLVAAVPLPDPVLQAGRRERRLAATC